MSAVEQLAKKVTTRMTGVDVDQVIEQLPEGAVVGADISGIISIIEALVDGLMSIMGKWQDVGCGDRDPIAADPDGDTTLAEGEVAVPVVMSDGEKVLAVANDMRRRPIANIARRIALTRELRKSGETHGMSRRDVVKARDALLEEVTQKENKQLVVDAVGEATSGDNDDYGWI